MAAGRASTPSGHRIVSMATNDAYDQWAEVYDTDGNILQGVDDIQLATILPGFLQDVLESVLGSQAEVRRLRILDIGCGTGRNTLKILRWCIEQGVSADIVGVDASQGMLDVAKTKLEDCMKGLNGNKGGENITTYSLLQLDMLDRQVDESEQRKERWVVDGKKEDVTGFAERYGPFDCAISTLVIEHLPLDKFFVSLNDLFPAVAAKDNQGDRSRLLITNMHPDMGARSQAGFVGRDETGSPVKVQATSFVHDVPGVVDAARSHGWAVDDDSNISEIEVTADMEQGLGRRAKKWVGCKVWFGLRLVKGISP